MPIYHTPTNHDLAQVQISLGNNVKWSGHFPYLFINRLKMKFICGAIWICGLSHFINQLTSLGIYKVNDYKSTAQNRAAPKDSIMVISRLLSSLIFMYDEPFTLS